MSDEDDLQKKRSAKRRGPLLWLAGRSRRFWIGVVAPPLLFGAYLASVGPVQRLGYTNGELLIPFVRPYCAPYQFICENAPLPIRNSMRSYVFIWVMDILAAKSIPGPPSGPGPDAAASPEE